MEKCIVVQNWQSMEDWRKRGMLVQNVLAWRKAQEKRAVKKTRRV